MEGSCDLEGAPGVTSNGGSPASSVGTEIPLPLEEKHRDSSADETCKEEESDSGSLEAQIPVDFSKLVISLGVKKGFHKSATFPTSAGQAEQDAGEVMKDAPAYERSLSLPPTLKLISAMKGSRQKNGMALTTENRHVRWAPDVYDPPVTSVCHSVNSSYHYQRRSKSRKEKNKKEKSKQKKKQKTKSKKGQQNSSLLRTPDLGLEDVSTSHSRGKHEAVILDYSISKEACGSSFLRKSVANMHFSIAEAS